MMNLVIDGSYGLAKPCENVETEKRLRKEEKEKETMTYKLLQIITTHLYFKTVNNFIAHSFFI